MISVVIPLYNQAQRVASCLQAAMRQRDFNDFEIVVVDDGSTDGSDKILDEMGENCNSLRIFHISNSGACAAMRYGVKQAKGDYIMFCDADGLLDEHALATAYDAITRTGADEVIGRFSNSEGKTIASYEGEVKADVLIKAILGNRAMFPMLCAILFRKELLDRCFEIPREITDGADKLVQLKVLMKEPKIVFIDACLYRHTRDAQSDELQPLRNEMLYDRVLLETLSAKSEIYAPYVTLFQTKKYEFYLANGNTNAFREYYHTLRQQDKQALSWKDKLVLGLPPTAAKYVVQFYKKTRRS